MILDNLQKIITESKESKEDMLDTKVTNMGGKYLLKIFKRADGKSVVQTTVDNREDISPAFKDMFRTLDKLGYDSKMAGASRDRDNPIKSVKHHWGDVKLGLKNNH